MQGTKRIVVLATAVLMVGSAGCAPTATTMSASALTDADALVVGWERFFKITWQPGERNGHPIVTGRIENTYGDAATRVQLVVEGLSDGGQVISRKIVWVGDDIPGFGSAYFEVPVAKAPRYWVGVFAYEWIESPDPWPVGPHG
jgi:hypothetical protein